MQFSLVISFLTVFGLGVLAPQAAPPAQKSPLTHVAIVGASVSAGYGIGPSPLGGAVNLADIVNASIGVEHDPPRNLASTLVFLNSTGYMEETSAALVKDAPSALIAIDYLFWAVHGVKSDTERMKQLESALATLDKVPCPILIGDLPDVSQATLGASPALTASMTPSSAVRDAANARIREWAKLHANVTVVPLADLLKKVNDRAGIQMRGNTWTGEETERLLQDDHLHATIEGLVAIWIAAADSWLSSDSKLSAESMELRAKTLVETASRKLKK